MTAFSYGQICGVEANMSCSLSPCARILARSIGLYPCNYRHYYRWPATVNFWLALPTMLAKRPQLVIYLQLHDVGAADRISGIVYLKC